jgi:hypothetical protein
MLARIAWSGCPSRSTTRSPVPMSVAMIDSGSGSFSISFGQVGATRWLKKSLIFSPPAPRRRHHLTPSPRRRSPSRESSAAQTPCSGSDLAVIGVVDEHVVPIGLGHGFAHRGRRESRRIGAGNQCAHAGAGNAVDRHPQPSRTSSTPMWAAPRAPPPPSTRPTLGRPASASPWVLNPRASSAVARIFANGEMAFLMAVPVKKNPARAGFL